MTSDQLSLRSAALSLDHSEIAALPYAGGTNRNALLYLIVGALFIPYSTAFYLGTLKLTPIKFLIVCLIFPATAKLIGAASRGQRRLLLSDACVLGVFILMFAGPVAISGTRDFVSALSQAFEFFGMYVITRALVFDDGSLRSLAKGLQIMTIVVVALGLLDIVFQRYVAQEAVWSVFTTSGREFDTSDPQLHRIVMGFSSLRAVSTFDHPILFGTFCATVLPLHLYAPESRGRRVLLVLTCILGSLIALSSAPLLALTMATSLCAYDMLMRKYAWRWKFILSAMFACVAAFSLASDNPLGFLFRNLTLDPQTAYFRLLIWEAGLDVIGKNLLLGIGFNPSGSRILDFSTDSLWLAKSIIFGIPMTTLLYLSAIGAMTPIRHQAIIREGQPFLDRMCTSFSIILGAIMFISITVTFWNTVWLFFALCIGVRASLKERCLLGRRELYEIA
ncbi:hypothetical protein IC762_09665 [Bradyrhizobium genosp. L]|uniref:O-antigen ligase family protein n=1 Tax=Bradyrhizobium genosp. L TaxID=83637 RepID=UPI0018A2DC78|nr:hypothetical protein [Bradyrhizobium genosp. L]QPF86522.1 hypothetical protein IC762_09665 [Bradyrhizobium genosp. L]